MLTGFHIDHARAFVAPQLVPTLFKLLLFGANPHEAGFHSAILADDGGVPPPPLFRLAQPNKSEIPIRHLRALAQATICRFTLQTAYKTLVLTRKYIYLLQFTRKLIKPPHSPPQVK